MESWIPAVTDLTCVEILYTIGVTLDPLLMCAELGQKEMKEVCAFILKGTWSTGSR